jgi:hypothetical protein
MFMKICFVKRPNGHEVLGTSLSSTFYYLKADDFYHNIFGTKNFADPMALKEIARTILENCEDGDVFKDFIVNYLEKHGDMEQAVTIWNNKGKDIVSTALYYTKEF